MTEIQSSHANPIQRGLISMFLTWGRCITWTVLLSALLAMLFALVIDGCS